MSRNDLSQCFTVPCCRISIFPTFNCSLVTLFSKDALFFISCSSLFYSPSLATSRLVQCSRLVHTLLTCAGLIVTGHALPSLYTHILSNASKYLMHAGYEPHSSLIVFVSVENQFFRFSCIYFNDCSQLRSCCNIFSPLTLIDRHQSWKCLAPPSWGRCWQWGGRRGRKRVIHPL